jgi:hypothetical protein
VNVPREPDDRTRGPRISRRVAIGAIVGTAALVVGGASVVALVDDDGAHTGGDAGSGSAESGSTVRGGDDALRRVGRRYVEVVPAEHDAALLARELRTAGVDPDGLAAATGLRDAAKRDYDAGAVLLLDGWLISRSEARYAGLIALRS